MERLFAVAGSSRCPEVAHREALERLEEDLRFDERVEVDGGLGHGLARAQRLHRRGELGVSPVDEHGGQRGALEGLLHQGLLVGGIGDVDLFTVLEVRHAAGRRHHLARHGRPDPAQRFHSHLSLVAGCCIGAGERARPC